MQGNRTHDYYFDCAAETLAVYTNEEPGTCTGSHVNTTGALTCMEATVYGVDVHFGYKCHAVPSSEIVQYSINNATCGSSTQATVGTVYMIKNVCHPPVFDAYLYADFSGMITDNGTFLVHRWWNTTRVCAGTPAHTRVVNLTDLRGCVEDGMTPDASGNLQTDAATTYVVLAPTPPPSSGAPGLLCVQPFAATVIAAVFVLTLCE